MYTGIGEFQYVAAYTVQVLELFETFDQELEWIWRRPWSWITCVFLFMRYGSLAIQTAILYQHSHATEHPYTHAQCFTWASMHLFAPVVYLSCIHIILIARVYALYDRSKRLLFVLALLLFSGDICAVTLFARSLLDPWESNSRCELKHVSHQNTYVWASLPLFCLDVVILTLTIKRALLLNRRPRPIPILRTIIVDGTWAVFVVWSAVVGAIFLAAAGFIQPSCIIANSWMPTMVSFAATRTILNVRRYKAPTLRHSDETDTTTEDDNIALTTHIPGAGTFTLKSRSGDS